MVLGRGMLDGLVRRGRCERVDEFHRQRGDAALAHRNRGLVAVVHLAAVLTATQAALEFVNGGLESAVKGVRTALTAHNRSIAIGGDLDMLAVLALAAILLMLKLDIETPDRVVDSFGAGEFLPHIDAVVVGNLDVAARHLDVGVRRAIGLLVACGQLRRFHGLG